MVFWDIEKTKQFLSWSVTYLHWILNCLKFITLRILLTCFSLVSPWIRIACFCHLNLYQLLFGISEANQEIRAHLKCHSLYHLLMTETTGSIVLKKTILYGTLSKIENIFFLFFQKKKAFLHFQHDLNSW